MCIFKRPPSRAQGAKNCLVKAEDQVGLFSAAMIHWARQIKEVLSSQDAFEMAETSGPLEEIEFWKNRCQDLSGISAQLDKPGVKKIEQILETAKSSYVVPFRKLASQIKVRMVLNV